MAKRKYDRELIDTFIMLLGVLEGSEGVILVMRVPLAYDPY